MPIAYVSLPISIPIVYFFSLPHPRNRCSSQLGATCGARNCCLGLLGAACSARNRSSGLLGATCSARKHHTVARNRPWRSNSLLGPARIRLRRSKSLTVRGSLGVLSAHRSKSQTKSLFEVTSLCLSTRLHFTRLQHCSVHVYARVHTSIYVFYSLRVTQRPGKLNGKITQRATNH